MIKFYCKNCNQNIKVADKYAGKKGKCPKCKNTVVIPNSANPATDAVSGPIAIAQLQETGCENELKITFKCQMCDADIDVSQSSAGQIVECSQCGCYGQSPEKEKKLESGLPVLPWFIDVFLYPLNLAGVIHLICLWLLVFLLCPLVIGLLGLGIEYIPIVYTLPIAYVLYYFTECIRESALGRCRAPDYWMHPTDFDIWDCISQLLVVLGCIAVCFCPVSVYFIVTARTDLIYWLLMACGGFFLPMTLLAVVLFDSFNAMNPILIIGSIFHTFFPYCGMVLLFYGGYLLFIKIDSRLFSFWLLPTVPFILKVLQFYLMFVAVGLLGRFYWKYRERLYWEV